MKTTRVLVAGGALLVIAVLGMILSRHRVINATGDASSLATKADELVRLWIQASPATVRSDEATDRYAADALDHAIATSGQTPTPAQVAAVVDEITRMGERWQKYHRGQPPVKEWWTSLQYKVYYFLRPSSVTPQEVRVRDRQHAELKGIMARLPQRMVGKWGVPVELTDDVINDNRGPLSHYESLLSSAFIRPSQIPLEAHEFIRLKERMGEELDRLGKSLLKMIRSNEQEWRSSLPKVRSKLPESFGADLLGRQRVTYRQFLTFFHGMAAKEFLLPQMLTVPDAFAWGDPDSYGVSHRRDSGWVVWFRPKANEPETRNANTETRDK